MKKILYILSLLLAVTCLTSCEDWLNLKPRDKISGEDLFSTPEGVQAFMASVYSRLPIEDFATSQTALQHNDGAPYQSGQIDAMMCDEAVYTSPWWFDTWAYCWSDYGLIRDILTLEEYIPNLDLKDQDKTYLEGEIAFCQAYCYFALTKRLGGMPILEKPIEYDPELQKMFRQRDKEIDCWNYVMKKCDEAAAKLPDSFGSQTGRANRWVALALKSRAALYAASYAENWNRFPFVGEAVDKGIVGMLPEDAPHFYSECIKASEEIINSGKFGLYKPNPADPKEAAKNYQHLFETPADALAESPTEVIWMKWYDEPGGTYRGHNYDIWYQPNQTRNGWSWGGYMSPILEFVDLFEDYTDDGKGESKPIRTKNVKDPWSEDINKYGAFADGWCGFDPAADYIHYADPTDAFKDKDARLHATVILPMSTWKGQKIIIQGGLIATNGWPVLKQNASQVGLDGKTYWAYGSDDFNKYSGYDEPHQGSQGGFLFKKFLQEAKEVPPQFNRGTNDWMEFRYAEILLNYAEAVVQYTEATGEQQQKAAEALNSIRHRAAHTDNIPLTFENVIKERRVELSFEHKRVWDKIRLRDFGHLNNYKRKDLIPVLDLRENPPTYIFLRADVEEVDRMFRTSFYYRELWMPIENGLIPQPNA